MSKKTIVLQAGHCFRKTGATGAPGEQEFTNAASLAAMRELERRGYNVRRILADESSGMYVGDAFVAFHYDSSNNANASGGSVGYQSTQGKQLGQLWKQYYNAHGWSRGYQLDNYTANLGGYYGVANAVAVGNRVAIITESGFHSNPGDKALLSPQRTAMSVADALDDYFGNQVPQIPEEDVTKDEVKAAIREVLHLSSDLNVPQGQQNNDNLAVNLTGMAQTNVNSQTAIKNAIAAVKADTAVTGDDELNIVSALSAAENRLTQLITETHPEEA